VSAGAAELLPPQDFAVPPRLSDRYQSSAVDKAALEKPVHTLGGRWRPPAAEFAKRRGRQASGVPALALLGSSSRRDRRLHAKSPSDLALWQQFPFLALSCAATRRDGGTACSRAPRKRLAGTLYRTSPGRGLSGIATDRSGWTGSSPISISRIDLWCM
jgi:hypothetical protein